MNRRVGKHWQARSHYWALEWPNGDLEGSLVGVYYEQPSYTCPRVQALKVALFATRAAAREFVRDRFNFESQNGTPVPVKVRVKMEPP